MIYNKVNGINGEATHANLNGKVKLQRYSDMSNFVSMDTTIKIRSQKIYKSLQINFLKKICEKNKEI